MSLNGKESSKRIIKEQKRWDTEDKNKKAFKSEYQ